ncbi:MAG: hypothetical protein M3Q16_02350 [Pseudomonadota bacterium]|nr:hypothetical protein [Pseudomonadota bacterium]
MADMTARGASATLLKAQTGQLLSEFLLGGPPPQQRTKRAGAKSTARGRAATKIDRAYVLDGGERLRIIDALITVIGGAYCHLAQKRAAYALDPVQALQLLRSRVAALSEGEFHLALTSIVAGLRDAHTRYTGPKTGQGRWQCCHSSLSSTVRTTTLLSSFRKYRRPH